MAEANSNAQEQTQSDSFRAEAAKFIQSNLKSFRDTVNPVIEKYSEPVLRDGMVGAFFRQGVDEFWQSLKAFPDGIQAQEPGALLEPLQTEVAEARREPMEKPSLDEILKAHAPAQTQQIQEKDQGLSL